MASTRPDGRRTTSVPSWRRRTRSGSDWRLALSSSNVPTRWPLTRTISVLPGGSRNSAWERPALPVDVQPWRLMSSWARLPLPARVVAGTAGVAAGAPAAVVLELLLVFVVLLV